MRHFLEIFEITTGQPERFAVVAIDPGDKVGNACAGSILTLHETREQADHPEVLAFAAHRQAAYVAGVAAERGKSAAMLEAGGEG